MEITFDTDKTNDGVHIITVKIIGSFDKAAWDQAHETFGRSVQALNGAPFRVLVDFSQSKAMTQSECELFLGSQNLAVQAGMQKDVFVSNNPILTMQLDRLSKKGIRYDILGPLVFKDSFDDSLAYLKAS